MGRESGGGVALTGARGSNTDAGRRRCGRGAAIGQVVGQTTSCRVVNADGARRSDLRWVGQRAAASGDMDFLTVGLGEW
jgi:hypothetical protein